MSDELITAYLTLAEVQIVGDQRGGIYDGAIYGRDLIDEMSRILIETVRWIGGATFAALEEILPGEVRAKMNWERIPYAQDGLR